MKTFLMSAVLKRTVLDNASLKVRASSLDHAYEIARDFLADFPNNTKQWSASVPMFIVENRESLDSDTIDLDAEDESSG